MEPTIGSTGRSSVGGEVTCEGGPVEVQRLDHRKQSQSKGLFGFQELKFNSHHINVPSNAWSTKCRLIACMLTQIMSNLRDESIKPN
jgi:hypothetical protein